MMFRSTYCWFSYRFKKAVNIQELAQYVGILFLLQDEKNK